MQVDSPKFGDPVSKGRPASLPSEAFNSFKINGSTEGPRETQAYDVPSYVGILNASSRSGRLSMGHAEEPISYTKL